MINGRVVFVFLPNSALFNSSYKGYEVEEKAAAGEAPEATATTTTGINKWKSKNPPVLFKFFKDNHYDSDHKYFFGGYVKVFICIVGGAHDHQDQWYAMTSTSYVLTKLFWNHDLLRIGNGILDANKASQIIIKSDDPNEIAPGADEVQGWFGVMLRKTYVIKNFENIDTSTEYDDKVIIQEAFRRIWYFENYRQLLASHPIQTMRKMAGSNFFGGGRGGGGKRGSRGSSRGSRGRGGRNGKSRRRKKRSRVE